jgi:hypothetical protein
LKIDAFAKSSELLNKLINSVYDRNPTNPNPLSFTVTELQIVEEWLKEILEYEKK